MDEQNAFVSDYLPKELTDIINGKAAPPSESEYRAFEGGRAGNRKMFELRYDDESYGISYAFLRACRFERTAKQHRLTLYTSLGRVTVSGQHLEEVHALLLAHKITWLQRLAVHQPEPTAPESPIIREIEFQSLPNED